MFLALATAAPAGADVVPIPDGDNPRLQVLRWQGDETYLLRMLPRTGLQLVLEPDEKIARIEFEGIQAFDVIVAAARDALIVTPKRDDAQDMMRVETDRRNYRFRLQVEDGSSSAYVIRLVYSEPVSEESEEDEKPRPPAQKWSYRLKGDSDVRPESISDNGTNIFVTFGDNQALPAVFSIGPSGDEQVVNGHMREDIFVIDRVWPELVFRIDEQEATAIRNSKPDEVNE